MGVARRFLDGACEVVEWEQAVDGGDTQQQP
jgi:hypothetical protein